MLKLLRVVRVRLLRQNVVRLLRQVEIWKTIGRAKKSFLTVSVYWLQPLTTGHTIPSPRGRPFHRKTCLEFFQQPRSYGYTKGSSFSKCSAFSQIQLSIPVWFLKTVFNCSVKNKGFTEERLLRNSPVRLLSQKKHLFLTL